MEKSFPKFSTAMTKSIKIHSLSLLLSLGCLISVQAQFKTPENELLYYKSKYPDYPLFFKQKSEKLELSLVGDSIVARASVLEEILHMSDNTNRYASQKLYSSSFHLLSDIDAYTLVPGKRKYQTYQVADIQESTGKESFVFYDDSKEYNFTFPSIQKGAKTILTYKEAYPDPRMMGMFFFTSYLPIELARYEVVFDPAIQMNYEFFNEEITPIVFKEDVLEDGRIRWTFEVKEVDKIKFADNAPSFNYLSASVYCFVASYTKADGTTVNLLSSTESLHDWYRTFVEGILEDDNSVKELAISLVDEADSDLEKVEKIYNWVQANIKYIAFEDGMRGLIPHPGAYVLEKRYGDCKDMASIIISLLRSVGIEAYYSWIGTRDIPYDYSEIPSPMVDNHMIATFYHDEQVYFLDATGQYSPIGLPTSMIQGKECLISKGQKDFEIVKVPVIPKEMNVMRDSVYLTLDKGNLKGEGYVSLTGYAKVFNTYKLVKSNQKSVDDYIERLLTKGSNKFEIGDYAVTNVDNLNDPINVKYDFELPGYYSVVGDQIYINPILDKSYVDVLIENRSVPIENEYKYINQNISVMDIPEGYELENLPNNQSVDTDFFGFNITYELSNGQLIASKEFYLNYLLLSPEDFEEWNDVIKKYSKACRQAIVLTKTK
jgi:hypothetical protein